MEPPPTPDPRRLAALHGAIASKREAADRAERTARYFEHLAPHGALDREVLASTARHGLARAQGLRDQVEALRAELAQLDRGRCGARCRSKGGAPCKAPRVKGRRRCRLHGGASTGPKSVEGKARALDALARSRDARVTRGAATSPASV